MAEILLGNACLVAGVMAITWLVSIPLRNVSIVDLIWGLGFVLIAGVTWFRSRGAAETFGEFPSRDLLLICTTLWGCRLSGYLTWRNWGEPEDKRYRAMRAVRPQSFWWVSAGMVFGLQAVIMWIISLPVQFGIARAATGWTALHGLGLLIWSVGLFFETVGDWQLARFRANPANRGQVCQIGLWRWTRHPNYFGDFCIWWGLFLLAIAHGEHLWTILSPAAMSFFLLRVSGVTLLESSLMQEKPGYAEYVQRTNAFFPGPPRQPPAG